MAATDDVVVGPYASVARIDPGLYFIKMESATVKSCLPRRRPCPAADGGCCPHQSLPSRRGGRQALPRRSCFCFLSPQPTTGVMTAARPHVDGLVAILRRAPARPTLFPPALHSPLPRATRPPSSPCFSSPHLATIYMQIFRAEKLAISYPGVPFARKSLLAALPPSHSS